MGSVGDANIGSGLNNHDGTAMRRAYGVPLPAEDEERMVGRFVSVTRATLKGTLVIGVVQGGLAGLALALAGIHSAVFWGTVMVALSIIPATTRSSGRPRGPHSRSSTPRRAASTSSAMRPPARLGLRIPAMRRASDSVGSVPPRP